MLYPVVNINPIINLMLYLELCDGRHIKLNFPVEGHLLRPVNHNKIS